MVTGEQVQQGTIQFNKGDNLFLYTDGLTESFNAEGVFYGEERLIEAPTAGDLHRLITEWQPHAASQHSKAV